MCFVMHLGAFENVFGFKKSKINVFFLNTFDILLLKSL